MFTYYFARADQMMGHNFTDDVAICKAWSKKSAIKKFSGYYTEVTEKEVKRIRWLSKPKVKVLTDY